MTELAGITGNMPRRGRKKTPKIKKSGGRKGADTGSGPTVVAILLLVGLLGAGWYFFARDNNSDNPGNLVKNVNQSENKAPLKESKQIIRRSALAAYPTVKSCFQKAVTADSSLDEVVIVQWTARWDNGEGLIRNGQPITMLSHVFESCIRSDLNNVLFDVPPGAGE